MRPPGQLRDMSPCFASLDERDVHWGYAKSASDVAARSGSLPYFPDGGFGKLGVGVLAARAMSTLKKFVAHIRDLVAQKQMTWVDAGPDIAFVQNVKATRDWAIRCQPRESMGLYHPLSVFHLPVSVGVNGWQPEQAPRIWFRRGSFFKLAPKISVVQRIFSHLPASFQRLLVRGGARGCNAASSRIVASFCGRLQ